MKQMFCTFTGTIIVHFMIHVLTMWMRMLILQQHMKMRTEFGEHKHVSMLVREIKIVCKVTH